MKKEPNQAPEPTPRAAVAHLERWVKEMSRRTTIILLVGVGSVAAFAAGSRYLVAKSKPQSEAEYRSERAADFRKKQDEEMERLFKEAMANDRPEKERRYAGYEYRMFKDLRAGKTVDSMFQPADGLDEFEALLLAKEYFSWQFGVCGWVDMPERQGSDWVVRISSGREARPESPIVIDAKTGALRCEGHPSVTDARAFIHGHKPPNQLPEPTAASGRGSS
jgi:hypothetical protein